MQHFNTKAQSGTVRIIGGLWRHRRISVLPQVRPTPDAVRETLFNWLHFKLPCAQCLELFAGTGALGFEALSRGAASVDMVEGNCKVVENLRKQAALFSTKSAIVYHLKLPEGLSALPPKRYDIVFMDAPFRKNLLLPCCLWLDENKRLKEGATVYLEMENELMPLSLPSHWRLWREKKAGQVAYCVYQVLQ